MKEIVRENLYGYYNNLLEAEHAIRSCYSFTLATSRCKINVEMLRPIVPSRHSSSRASHLRHRLQLAAVPSSRHASSRHFQLNALNFCGTISKGVLTLKQIPSVNFQLFINMLFFQCCLGFEQEGRVGFIFVASSVIRVNYLSIPACCLAAPRFDKGFDKGNTSSLV